MADKNVSVETDQSKDAQTEHIHYNQKVGEDRTRLVRESHPPSSDGEHSVRHDDDRDEKAGSAHFQDEVVANCSESWRTHDDDPQNDVSSEGENVDDH